MGRPRTPAAIEAEGVYQFRARVRSEGSGAARQGLRVTIPAAVAHALAAQGWAGGPLTVIVDDGPSFRAKPRGQGGSIILAIPRAVWRGMGSGETVLVDVRDPCSPLASSRG